MSLSVNTATETTQYGRIRGNSHQSHVTEDTGEPSVSVQNIFTRNPANYPSLVPHLEYGSPNIRLSRLAIIDFNYDRNVLLLVVMR